MGGKRGRPKTERIKQLKRQIVAALALCFPQSVRHMFYLMTNPELPVSDPKTESGYKCVQRCCLALRRENVIPYGWIVDATRRGHHVLPFDDGGQLNHHFAGLYRRDLWRSTDVYVEVWCESESIGGVIQQECERLGVSLYPTKGFSSVTLTAQASEGIRACARGRPVKIVYVGDYDRAGTLIDDKVMDELRLHLPDHDLEKIRVAITEEQAARLPSRPLNENDKRAKELRRTVEAEAMPASELRALVRETVEGFLPRGALHAAQTAERSEREGLERLADLTEFAGHPERQLDP